MKRGKCRYCGKTFALTKAGRLRKHRCGCGCGAQCGGTGQVPA